MIFLDCLQLYSWSMSSNININDSYLQMCAPWFKQSFTGSNVCGQELMLNDNAGQTFTACHVAMLDGTPCVPGEASRHCRPGFF